MDKTNAIGLDTAKSKKLAEKLNVLLANYSLFYINTRGFHWNIRGDKFFTLHIKFEELYNDLFVKIDELAERIVTLGYTPKHAYSDYLKTADIKEMENVSDGDKAVKEIVNSFQVIISQQREIMEAADKMNDEGTSDMMTAYTREQEKMVWMYNSYLGKMNS